MLIVGPEFDLIIAEGFRKSKVLKVEVHRKELGDDLLCSPEELLAIVTDKSLDTMIADDCKLSNFRWGDTVTAADFVEKDLLTAVS